MPDRFAVRTVAIRTVAAVVAMTLVATSAARSQEPWASFAKLPAERRQQTAAALSAQLPTSPWLQAQRQLAARSTEDRPARTAALGSKRAKRSVEFPGDPDPLHRRVDYQFGLGTITVRPPAAAGGKPAKPAPAKPANKPAAGGTSDPEQVGLQQALAGLAPDVDHALAVLLRELDHDPRGDTFAVFLQSWRNEDESFYEALDRTAGTPDSVFFFDVMLDDFRGRFGHGQGPAKLGGGLQVAHDALHDAFLSYRQYRGFREAMAWSFVLPPDLPLPARLARYEAKVEGSYSLRQQVTMVAARFDHDPARLVAAIRAAAPPLPEPLWHAKYDPYPPWLAVFQELQPAMIERHGSTDACLAAAEAERRAASQAVAAAARELLQQALVADKHH